MNWQTKQKAEEIKILLNEGYDLKDILQKKFNRSTSKLKEHLLVAKEMYTELEFSILDGKEKMEISVKKEVPQQVAEVFSIEKMKALENLINHSDELLALLNKKNFQDITNHLIIPNDLLQISDIKVKSIRISEKIEGDFNKFCDEFKQYSKTSLLNFALVEFMEKYNLYKR